MGVTHKLRPEVKDYILEIKKNKPGLGCRSLSPLIEEKFKIRLSKSSINFIIKDAGLSMPVGRRQKKRRQIRSLQVQEPRIPSVKAPVAPAPFAPAPVEAAETESSGVILLKAADYLLGGTYQITEAIRRQLKSQAADLLEKTESLLYSPLSGVSEGAQSYLNELQQVTELPKDIAQAISGISEVRGLKVSLQDAATFCIDGQFHTIWPDENMPDDFATSTYNIKTYINKYFQENAPLVLFMAPGYNAPPVEFFNFMLSLRGEKQITSLSLIGEKEEGLSLKEAQKRSFIFGLWPWQYRQYRKVKVIKELRKLNFSPLNKDFYLAETEIELSQPNINQHITLRGCVLKHSPQDKIILAILSNLASEGMSLEDLANNYLNSWPSPEEGFQDFSRKSDLFAYTERPARFLPTENLSLKDQPPQDIKSLFNAYLNTLDLYVKWRFLPGGYANEDFSTINERFYSLKARLKKQKNYTQAVFTLPAGYQYAQDLEYACKRINERRIILPHNKRLWCAVS